MIWHIVGERNSLQSSSVNSMFCFAEGVFLASEYHLLAAQAVTVSSVFKLCHNSSKKKNKITSVLEVLYNNDKKL